MPDLHKTLILAHLVPKKKNEKKTTEEDGGEEVKNDDDDEWDIHEVAIATEHAPFRHKKTVEVGGQRKRPKHS